MDENETDYEDWFIEFKILVRIVNRVRGTLNEEWVKDD